MRNKYYLMSAVFAGFLTGCDMNILDHDITSPSIPQGLYAEPGDGFVGLNWLSNPERDLKGYNVYVRAEGSDKFLFIGSTREPHFDDCDIINGVTYYYAVAAYDRDGNESGLSIGYTYATPRPEGYDLSLTDFKLYPERSGYDFSTYSIGYYDDEYSDIFFENYNGTLYLNVWDDTEIQDLGYTGSLYDITGSPTLGWAPSHDARVVLGHTYAIKTWDDHYAKIRITSISRQYVVFDWAYQLQKFNPLLKHGTDRSRDMLKRYIRHSG